eukprot:Gb_13146 [translate_table: standard]
MGHEPIGILDIDVTGIWGTAVGMTVIYNIVWEHAQVIEIGDIATRPILALLHHKGKLYSGHSDGSIKVWEVKRMCSELVQEVREHTKSVTCFALFEPGNSVLSGSTDKTVRIWNIVQKKLECMRVVELKDPIHRVDSHGHMLIIVTQSSGVKVHHQTGIVKVLNGNKHVESLVVAGDKMYCGCKDSSIQVSLSLSPWASVEINVTSNEAKHIQECARTWLGKKPVYSIVPFRDWIYTAGALINGISLKVWKKQDGTLLSMASTGSDVQRMAVTEDFIYLNCHSSPNTLQIWLREKLHKVTSLSFGSKITSLLAANDVIFCGTANGTIKASKDSLIIRAIYIKLNFLN